MRTAAQTSKNETLEDALAPYMNNPLALPQMFVAGLQFISGKLTALQEKQDARDASAGEAAMFLPADKLGQRYGMTPKGISPYLLRWSAAGDVQKIAPIHPGTGRAGVPRYRVADVDRMMTGTPKQAKR